MRTKLQRVHEQMENQGSGAGEDDEKAVHEYIRELGTIRNKLELDEQTLETRVGSLKKRLTDIKVKNKTFHEFREALDQKSIVRGRGGKFLGNSCRKFLRDHEHFLKPLENSDDQRLTVLAPKFKELCRKLNDVDILCKSLALCTTLQFLS